MNLDGREIELGDKLYCLANGWGVVTYLDNGPVIDYPLTIMFDYNGDQSYTVDGRLDFNLPRCLYWDKPEIVAPKPKQKVKRWRWAVTVADAGHIYDTVTEHLTVDELNNRVKRFGETPIGRILETEEEIWV
jgi:hypothetical protein